MGAETILAIDIGTTNCKTILLDDRGKLVHKESVEYSVQIPHPGWSEQQPEDWWDAVQDSIIKVVRKVNPTSIKAIGLSGQMHGLVLLNAAGVVLRPAILWNDQRTSQECEDIYARVGGPERLLSYTNNAMLPGYTGGKILWVKNNEPDLFEKAAHVLLPKDYVRFRLTGHYATDVSDASGTGLFDVENRIWASGLLEKIGIPQGWLPRAYESGEIAGELQAAAAEKLGLPAHLPVIAGGGDAVMQTIGSAATSPEKCLIVVGTGGNVTVSIQEFAKNPGGRLQHFCHSLPGMWVEMGVTLSAGNSLRWFRDTFGIHEVNEARKIGASPYELLGKLAATSPAGAGGVLFLPYLQGERCPYSDVHAAGTFTGIRLNTERADLLRAVYEGVAFSLRDVLELILQTGASPEVIHLSGGGSSSELWQQIHADILNREVRTLDYAEDASAVGAAMVAGVNIGLWSNIEDAVQNIRVRSITEPVADNVPLYSELFEVYKDLYPALKPSFQRLASAAE